MKVNRSSLLVFQASMLLLWCSSACKGLEPTIPMKAMDVAKEVKSPPEPIIYEDPILDEEEFSAVAYVAPAKIGSDELVSFQLRGIPLGIAIHMIADQAGVNIYLDSSLDREVDAAFPSVTINDALHALLSRNGLRLMEEPEGIYWVEPSDGSEAETARFRVQSIDAGSIVEDLEALVSDGASLVVNAEQNLILVDGTSRDVNLVATYLESVDRLKRQVLLEVELIEFSLDEEFELGFANLITDGDICGPNLLSLAQALTTGNGEFSLTLDNSDIPLISTLTALEQYIGVNVLSSPRVLVTTKSAATVEVVTEVPYVQATITSTIGDGTAGASTTEEIEFKEVGLKMIVTPTVQEGGMVEITVDQVFSNVIEFFQGVPVIDSRNLATVMLVENQCTAVIGGLIENSIAETDTGVPWLMNVPLVGRIFRSDDDAAKKRQLLVFITPRIVSSKSSSRVSEQYQKNFRDSVKAAGLTPAGDL